MALWAKLGAGIIAALAVVSIGIYVALPHDCCSAGKGDEPAPKGSCCSGDHSDGCPVAAPVEPTPIEGCCAACCSKVDADALAACGSGLTVQPTAKAKPKASCCGE